MAHAPSNSEASGAFFRTEDLLQRVQRGDAGALNILFERFRDPLERYLHSQLPFVVRSVQDTQDAVQEVMMRTYQSLTNYHHKGVGSLWGYIRTIARNYVIETFRERKKWGSAKGGEDGASFGSAPAKGPSPPETVLAHERVERYEKALQKLPERTRIAFLMRIELGSEFQWIATDCGFATADAARMAVKRAAKFLAEEMGAGAAEN